MIDNKNYLVKNVTRKSQGSAAVRAEFLTKGGTPVAFSREAAEEFVRIHGGTEEDIVVVPDDTIVVLDRSARKLPQSPDVGAQMHDSGIRTM